jgi:alpha-galactosidase
MFGHDRRLVVRRPGEPPQSTPIASDGVHAVGGVEVVVRFEAVDGVEALHWSVANTGATAIALDAVALEWTEPAGDAVHWFANGYQSWSPTGARRLGVDADPSQHPDSIGFVRAVHHADPAVAAPGELRSELVTAVDLGTGDGIVCVGFAGGACHSGTLRARLDAPRPRQVALRAEAWLGGAQLPPGTRRELHAVERMHGADAPALLDAWAARAGRNEHARNDVPYHVGWCSWYQYFHDVTQVAITDNLARAADWPFTLFQVDDGYQHDIGDWLTTNDRFPGGVDAMASAIARTGMTPGLWLAPFIAAPSSDVAAAHPEWFARDRHGEPLPGMFHEVWGGVMWQLDVTREDVLEHLATTARTLVEMGYRYLKLDFTFSSAVRGTYAVPTRTPAERVRAGYEAIRTGAGDDIVLLGCGCPLGAVVGVVDAMRIGPDVAPSWEVPPDAHPLPGYEAAAPSTRNAWNSTLGRSFMHRRLWANDPDCLMLRTSDTALAPEASRAWAYAVGLSGGLAVVSDDLALLGPDERALLDEVVALGRAADAEAQRGRAPRCEDLLDPAGPGRLSATGRELVADPGDPRPAFVNRS